ncbi:MAG: hypothetical protein JO247_07285 [Chloroflexi bacterium]|nr:hypothetical protein [Chloroflexota bacterium]
MPQLEAPAWPPAQTLSTCLRINKSETLVKQSSALLAATRSQTRDARRLGYASLSLQRRWLEDEIAQVARLSGHLEQRQLSTGLELLRLTAS